MFVGALTTGVLLVLPGAALAATDVAASLNSPVDVVAGADQTYTVTVTNTTATATAGAVAVDFDLDFASGAAITSVTPGTQPVTLANAVTCTTTGCDAAGLAGNEFFTATIVVRAPKHTANGVTLNADVTVGGGDTGTDDSDSFNVTANGGPSKLAFAYGPRTPAVGVVDKWVKLGSTYSETVTVTNTGTGTANFANIHNSVYGGANDLFSPEPPVFAPVATVQAGGACTPTSATNCELAPLAAGASSSFTVVVSGLDHYGIVSYSANVDSKGDNGDDLDFDSSGGFLSVTDGSTTQPIVDIDGAPATAAGNTPVTFNGDVVNAGPDAITNGILRVTASSFNAAGDGVSSTNPTAIQSIQTVTLAGVACPARVVGGVTRKDDFVCAVASLPTGQRLALQVVAKFATTKADQTGAVGAGLETTSFVGDSASDVDGFDNDQVRLNPSKTMDLEVGVSSAALVGLDRVVQETVTVTNKGATKATGVSLAGALSGAGGTFDSATLPTTCAGIAKPQFAKCFIGSIEPGATATVVLPVRGGTKLGALAAEYTVSSDGAVVDTNDDNDTITHVVTIVKANTVPLLGVKQSKVPVTKRGTLGKFGLKSTVTCPVACTAKVDLKLTRKQAVALGIKVPKFGAADILVGSATKKLAAPGNVVVTTKLALKYKAKIVLSKKKIVAKRVTTVVSTEKNSAGASALLTQAFTIK